MKKETVETFDFPSIYQSFNNTQDVSVDDRRKKKRLTFKVATKPHAPDKVVSFATSSSHSSGDGMVMRLKSSVQKIVDLALNPFVNKLKELFDPKTSTLECKPDNIALWNADLLLTKFFDQNELTKYFTSTMNQLSKTGTFTTEIKSAMDSKYRVDCLQETKGLDGIYTSMGTADSLVPDVETLNVGGVQIINYSQMDPKHIERYVRLIALYKYRIPLRQAAGTEGRGGPGSLLTPLLEEDSTNHFQNIVGGLAVGPVPPELNLVPEKQCIAKLYSVEDITKHLMKRAIADLDARLNPTYQEEMVMHINIEKVERDPWLPISIGIFLAKGCSFCRKKECKAEDLTTPIGPDNPVCPDRQCIVKNLVCDVCNKQMASSKSLARHKYSLHDEGTGENAGNYICSHCGEGFSKKWKLNVHEKQHEDKKMRVTCHICNKVVKGVVSLKKHINMVHEAKRQFSCDHCHKLFKRKETLMVHVRIHTGEKPYACSLCDYSSETKGQCVKLVNFSFFQI